MSVPLLAQDDLIRRACAHYNARRWQSEREPYGPPARADSDPLFLERIAVNYLRHELSPYEAQLGAIYGRVGVREGYIALKAKVLAAIAVSYPEFAAECERQAASLLCDRIAE